MNRIVLNSAATWSRGAAGLVLGLFTSRWALQSLGAEGYGLWALCCSVNLFACFAQGVVANASQRFLSVAVGRGDGPGWYRLCLKLHVVTAFLTLAVAAPVSFWLLGNWLSVPAARLGECRAVLAWVFAFSFLAMANTANRQVFAAHQRLLEPALWGILSLLISFFILAWMVTHPGDWLVAYAALVTASVCLTEGGLAWRAWRAFGREPQSVPRQGGVADVLRFAAWRFVADGGWTVSSYGMTILVNRLFGATLTASAGLARSAATHVNSLCFAVASAYEPALANRAGAHDADFPRAVAQAAVRQTLAYLVLAAPLFALAEPLLGLWLGTVPPQLVPALRMLLVAGAGSAFGGAFAQACSALGRVRALYVVGGLLQAAVIPLAFAFVRADLFGGGLTAVFAAVAVTQLAAGAWSCAAFAILPTPSGSPAGNAK